MARTTTMVLELHVIDTTPGAWCPTCLLPSAITARWVAVNPSTLRTVTRGSCCVCADCGRTVDDAGRT